MHDAILQIGLVRGEDRIKDCACQINDGDDLAKAIKALTHDGLVAKAAAQDVVRVFER